MTFGFSEERKMNECKIEKRDFKVAFLFYSLLRDASPRKDRSAIRPSVHPCHSPSFRSSVLSSVYPSVHSSVIKCRPNSYQKGV